MDLEDCSLYLKVVGFVQIFSIVSQLSLKVQYSKNFSTTALYNVKETMREIEKLAQRWEWQDESKFLNIGTPLELIEGLRNGCFQVKVNERVRKMKAGKINRSREYRRELFGHNVDQNGNLDDKVTWEEVSPRNIVINNFETYKEIKICGQLQEVCSVLLEKLSERMYIQPPVEISVNIFYSN